jgi:hypothetical protein
MSQAYWYATNGKEEPTMKKAPKTPAPLDCLLATLADQYEEEIHRLADELQPRILAGEFSGIPGGWPGWLVLASHLEGSNKWLATRRRRLVTLAACRWLEREEKALTDPMDGHLLSGGVVGDGVDDRAAGECMSHDVLAVAAARGWVKRMGFINDPDPYALKVA